MKLLAQFYLLCAYVFVRSEWFELRILLRALGKRCLPTGRLSVAEQLLISGEDHRFFSHLGIDFIAVLRACYQRIFFGKREGASTIEMQIVRVITGRYERTFRRKLREMALATLIGTELKKEQLPAIYLRIGYFGWRLHGFATSTKRLGVRARGISRLDAARIVARLKYPQPRRMTLRRQQQIEMRARHLCRLIDRHRREQRYGQWVTEFSNAAV
jgi:membrane carboxypeptidase/penicillin-binding protein PbpC